MTIQDPQIDDDLDESTHGTADIEEDQPGSHLSRSASGAVGQQGMGASNPRHQAGPASGLQIQLTGNAGANAKVQDRSVRSSSDVSSPGGGLVNFSVSGESTSAAVPPWESNSAAAWVKQKSLEKSQSAAAQLADWQQQEEEKSRQQATEADQDTRSSPASGKGRALGGLHIQVEEKAPQDGLQEWTESGLDDIAAAVAQYTGASPDELMAATDDQQDGELGPEQAMQLHKLGSQQLARTPRASTPKAHATQQDQGNAAFNSAAAAAAGPQRGNAPRYANAQEQMEAELEAAMAADNDLSAAAGGAAAAPVYANALEQMEAELEAAMAAEAGQDAMGTAQSADSWKQIEQDASKAANDVIGELHRKGCSV